MSECRVVEMTQIAYGLGFGGLGPRFPGDSLLGGEVFTLLEVASSVNVLFMCFSYGNLSGVPSSESSQYSGQVNSDQMKDTCIHCKLHTLRAKILTNIMLLDSRNNETSSLTDHKIIKELCRLLREANDPKP